MSSPDSAPPPSDKSDKPTHFIRQIIDEHLAAGRYSRVVTRFPPEPNGYLHIGHAKSICLNFGLARDYGGVCHLRMDDTNPTKEETEYVESIMADVRWLGFDWQGQLFYASDYFPRLFAWAELLIEKGLAYVDSLTRDEVREARGSLTEPGRNSPYRDRSVAENLDLFRRMKAGEFDNGAHVLRAKIDMSHPNMLMRDPPLYRILRASHHRTGDAWSIYPMYDYAHCLSDATEGISHSICTLEFENNRELYDWVLDAVGLPEPRPHQYEFARLSLDYTVMSKRKLLVLVKDGHVDGWDDPRMPTIAGLRRRGVRPEAIRAFAEMIGVAKTNSTVDIGKLEYCIREDLNPIAPRVMAVLKPLKLVLENWPEDRVDWFDAPYWPSDIPREGTRKVPFARTLWIEQDDFMEHPPKDFHRLAPGTEVRLRYGYVIRCTRVEKDAEGRLTCVFAEVDTDTRHGGEGANKKKVKGTIHWVSAVHSLPAEVRLYDRLFTVPQPDREDGDFLRYLNPASKVVAAAQLEPSLATMAAGTHVQFERHGFFFADPIDHRTGSAPVFSKVVGLKDAWVKLQAREAAADVAPVEKASAPKKSGDGRPDKLTRAEARERRFQADPTLAARFEHFRDGLHLAEDEAELCAETHALADFFEAALATYAKPESVAKWVVNEVLRELKEQTLADLHVTPAALGRLAELVDGGVISSSAAKQVFADLVQSGGSPDAIVAARGLRQVSDRGALEAAADAIIAANPEQVARYRSGKAQLFGFFVGQVMKASGGNANPEMVAALLKAKLG